MASGRQVPAEVSKGGRHATSFQARRTGESFPSLLFGRDPALDPGEGRGRLLVTIVFAVRKYLVLDIELLLVTEQGRAIIPSRGNSYRKYHLSRLLLAALRRRLRPVIPGSGVGAMLCLCSICVPCSSASENRGDAAKVQVQLASSLLQA